MTNYPVRELPSERSFGLLFGDVLEYDLRVLPGQMLWDSLGVDFRSFTEVLPFLRGRSLVHSTRDVRDLLVLFAVFGLSYLPLVLWENCKRPNLHIDLCGYHSHAFFQPPGENTSEESGNGRIPGFS